MANLNTSHTGSITNSLNTAADKAKSAVNSGLASTGMAGLDMDQINQFKDQAMDKAAAFYEQSEKVVRRNPFYFIGGAALLGYVAGMLLSSRKQ